MIACMLITQLLSFLSVPDDIPELTQLTLVVTDVTTFPYQNGQNISLITARGYDGKMFMYTNTPQWPIIIVYVQKKHLSESIIPIISMFSYTPPSAPKQESAVVKRKEEKI